MKNSSPLTQNLTVYTLGWGQLNADGLVDNPIQFKNLQLDIVGFLAILGEGAVTATSQVATLSRMIYLPRLLPAPQALLRPSRSDKLDPVSGQATGVQSGNVRAYINYIGHILANAESLPDYAVKCVRITRVKNLAGRDGEIKARTFGPTWIVAALGCVLSLVLFALAIWLQDGMAMLADLCLSFLSTLVGIANKWKLNLPKRVGGNHWTPPGDVVLKYPKGNFVVVSCDEDVARELFFAPEGIEYHVARSWKYRMIALAGTILLMFGVIFLGNAGTYSQVAFAGSFMILNAAFWVIAALPPRYHWDFRAFKVEPQAFDEPAAPESECTDFGKKDVDKSIPPYKKRKEYVSYNDTFTKALWKVIIATRDIKWIETSGAAPQTPAWNQWLQEALRLAEAAPDPEYRPDPHGADKRVLYYNVPDWNPQDELKNIILEMKNGDMEKAEKRYATNSLRSRHSITGNQEKGAVDSARLL